MHVLAAGTLATISCRDLWVSNGRHHAVHSTYAGGLYSLFVLFCRNLKHMGMHVMAAVNSSADLRPTAASRPALDSLALNSKFHQKSTPTNPLTFHTIHHFYISASLPRHSQHTSTLLLTVVSDHKKSATVSIHHGETHGRRPAHVDAGCRNGWHGGH